MNLTPSEQHAADRCGPLTQAHPHFPNGAIVRHRMHSGSRGLVILSRTHSVSVRWAQPAAFVETFDGWQAGNSLRITS